MKHIQAHCFLLKQNVSVGKGDFYQNVGVTQIDLWLENAKIV
jgi:hypothetical protein